MLIGTSIVRSATARHNSGLGGSSIAGGGSIGGGGGGGVGSSIGQSCGGAIVGVGVVSCKQSRHTSEWCTICKVKKLWLKSQNA